MGDGEGISKRVFLRLVALFGAVLSLLPFSPVLSYLIPPVTTKFDRKKIGNVEELAYNSYKIFVYPSDKEGDKVPDPYHTNLLIRNERGEYVAFNRVCVHLQCLVSYYGEYKVSDKDYGPSIACPCHGSIYWPSDAIPREGPAVQVGRGLPRIKLEIDERGDIYAVGIEGLIGYGRELKPTT